MIPQHNKHFRFRFSLVLFLVFLLTSPTQSFSAGKNCDAVLMALGGVEVNFPLGKAAQFVRNLADCLNSAKKTYSETQGIIKQLPELIDKVLPVAKKEGLVPLSLYLLYKSFVLYEETMILEENVRMYRNKLDALEKKMKPLRGFIDNELIPQFKEGNTTNLEKLTDKLLQILGLFSKEIQELTQDIRRDSLQGGRYQRFSAFFAVSTGVLCVYPLVWAIPHVSIPVCCAPLATAGYSWWSYSSLCKTLPKLELLEKDATKMNEEITNYQTEIHHAKTREEF